MDEGQMKYINDGLNKSAPYVFNNKSESNFDFIDILSGIDIIDMQ